jgi:hypothetical protein
MLRTSADRLKALQLQYQKDTEHYKQKLALIEQQLVEYLLRFI